MTNQFSTAVLFAAMLLGASLAGACSGDANQPPDADTAAGVSGPDAPARVAEAAPPAAEPHVAGAAKSPRPIVKSPGKGGAPIDLAWNVDGKPQIGVPLAIDLEFIPTGDVSDLTVQVSAGRGLGAEQGHGDLKPVRLSRTGGYQHRVVVTPAEDGLAYVHVIVTALTPNGPQVRTFAVPVTTGDGGATIKRKAAGQIETDRNGDRVRVLPAREDSGG